LSDTTTDCLVLGIAPLLLLPPLLLPLGNIGRLGSGRLPSSLFSSLALLGRSR
jgi:hypothetical protein